MDEDRVERRLGIYKAGVFLTSKGGSGVGGAGGKGERSFRSSGHRAGETTNSAPFR
jgi:hypothetical protein